MRTLISNTSTFISFPKFKQEMYLRKESVKKLKDSLIQAKNLGFEKWKELSGCIQAECQIIKEILENEIHNKQ